MQTLKKDAVFNIHSGFAALDKAASKAVNTEEVV